MTNISLTLSLSYAPPDPPPDSGAKWPEELDWPGITAMVSLPVSADDGLAHDLRSGELCCCGDFLRRYWGELEGGERRVYHTFRASTLAAAEAAARAWHADGAAVIAPVLAARAARLAQREATIAAALRVHGEVVAP